MKRFIVFLLILVLFALPASADIPDISSLTSGELQELKDMIETKLIADGVFTFIEISKNDSGDHVIRLQKRLLSLGFFSSDITGKFDAKTMSAMKSFEKANGLKQDGVASINDQVLAFSNVAISKPTPSPKPTPKPTKTPRPTPTPDPYAEYADMNFKELSRYPDRHMYEKYRIYGTVIQSLGNMTDGFDLRVATKGGYDNVVYIVVTDPPHNLIEDDAGAFFCWFSGMYTYETVMGGSVNIPLFYADHIEIIN